jgi:hypothetical protein
MVCHGTAAFCACLVTPRLAGSARIFGVPYPLSYA